MAADPAKFKKTQEISAEGIFFCVARVPNSGLLYAGSSDFRVYELDTTAEKPQPVAWETENGHQSYVTGITLAGRHLVSGSYDGRLIWWDREAKQPLKTVEAHDKWIRRVTSNPAGTLVASVADDMLCKIWDAESGELIQTLVEHKPLTPNNYPSMLYAVAFSPDGSLLATGDKTGHVAVWDTSNWKKIGEVETPVMYTWDPRQRRHSIGGIRSLAFSPDSRLLAVGGIGKIGNIDHLGGPSRIEVFDWRENKRLHELEDEKYKGLVETLHFDNTGQWFLATGGDHNGFISFYETETGQLIKQDKAPMHVHQAVFDETCEHVYAAGHGRFAVWELTDPDAPVVAPKPA